MADPSAHFRPGLLHGVPVATAGPVRAGVAAALAALGAEVRALEVSSDEDAPPEAVGWNHLCLTVDDLDGTLENLAGKGIEPEKPPYRVREGGSRICFVRDPDGYRIELIEKGA